MKAWENWKVAHPEDFRELNQTQLTQYFDDWGVAGTLDLLGDTKLIDIKTSRKVSDTYWLQLAVYNRRLGRERWVLRLDKNLGEYEYVRCPEKYSQEYCEDVFVSMLNVFNFFKEAK